MQGMPEELHALFSGRDVGSISNLGARHFEGTFSLRKKGHFLEIKRALLCLLQNLGGHVPPVPPVPMSVSSGETLISLDEQSLVDTV